MLGLGASALIDRAPELLQQFSQSYRTDLSLSDVIELARVGASIPDENIRNEVLDQNYVSGYLTDAGASVLIPLNDQIAPLLQELYYSE